MEVPNENEQMFQINGSWWKKTQLFGGAIECCIPVSFSDVSEIRDLQDNEEAFGNKETDQSIIISLNSMDSSISKEELGKFHFQEIAVDNEASLSQIIFTETLGAEFLSSFG